MSGTTRWLPVLVLAAAVIVVAPSTGRAQLPGISAGAGNGSSMKAVRNGAADKPAIAAPDALPGSKARTPAAPATHAAGDMQPTEALFDAINRGDVASARDALNRGADMNGVNVLGMTPMELSVDLGRNDISFLLLSMRGEDSGRGSRSVGRDAATSPAQAARGPAAGAARATKPVAAASARNARVENTPEATKPIATPKLFANDGGAPVPNAGFLGFGSRPAAN